MFSQKKLRENQEVHDNLGLMANGSSGDWEVAVDETTSGPSRWFLQIEGPTSFCSFEISSPKAVREVLLFLQWFQEWSRQKFRS
jgi:hypothetical protein